MREAQRRGDRQYRAAAPRARRRAQTFRSGVAEAGVGRGACDRLRAGRAGRLCCGAAGQVGHLTGHIASTRGPCHFPGRMSRSDLGPKSRLGYTESRLARAAERRKDPDALEAMIADPAAGVYVIANEMIVLKSGDPNEPLFSFPEAQALAPLDEAVFLGL